MISRPVEKSSEELCALQRLGLLRQHGEAGIDAVFPLHPSLAESDPSSGAAGPAA